MSEDDRLKCLACGQIHPGARLVTLPDGRVVGNHSEAYRAFCEADYVAKLPTLERRRKYIQGVEDKRGVESANILKRNVRELWQQRPQS